MLGQTVAQWVPVGIIAWIAGMIVLFWPLRRNRRFSVSRVIPAPPEWIWGVHHTDLDNPHSAALHDTTVSVEIVEDDPSIREHIIDLSGGHRTNLIAVRALTLEETPLVSSVTRVCEIDGETFPFGPDSTETFELSAHPDGTLATIAWQGQTETLLQFVLIWRQMRGHLRKLSRLSKTNSVEPHARSRRPMWTSLAVSVFAIGSFALWLGWVPALLLTAILVIHEFGHWLAMRLTGQPAPRVILIPFFGGITVANQPHKSLFADAFCFLMGAGFSLLPCLGFLLVAYVIAPDGTGFGWAQDYATFAEPRDIAAFVALTLGLGMAFLNMFQLLPILPLDGGQVLRAVLQSFGAGWARWIPFGATGLAVAFFTFTEIYILAGLCALGVLQAWYLARLPVKSRPMGGAEIVAIGFGYVLTLGIYTGVIVYGAWLYGHDFIAIVMR